MFTPQNCNLPVTLRARNAPLSIFRCSAEWRESTIKPTTTGEQSVQPSHAETKKRWTYRGPTVWDHPDGRQISASLADSCIKDDSLSIIRDRRDNRSHIIFTYRRIVRFGNGRPYFFIKSKLSTVPAAQRSAGNSRVSRASFNKADDTPSTLSHHSPRPIVRC